MTENMDWWNTKKFFYWLITVCLLVGILPMIHMPILAVSMDSGSYIETFNETTYSDAAATNATGWGSGTISSPSKSYSQIGSYNTPEYARGIFITGDWAFIADSAGGMQIINITNLAGPTLTGFANTSIYAENIFVEGKMAYIADPYAGLRIVNMSDPTSPSLIATYNTPDYPSDVFVDGDHAFVADSLPTNSSLQIINISNSANPTYTGSYESLNDAEGVYIDGNRAFIADGVNGLVIINITNLAFPSLEGSYNTPGYARDVVVAGDHAFIADSDYGLQIINISDTANPSFTGTYNTAGFSRGVCVEGDWAYISDENPGLQIIDISDLSNPVLIDTFDTSGRAYDASCDGTHAFIAVADYGLQIIEVSELFSPTLTDYHGLGWSINGVTVAGDFAYVTGSYYLQIFNISDPENLNRIGYESLSVDRMEGVYVSGNYAFLAAGETGGLRIANISDPKNPTFIGNHSTPGTAYDIFVSGNIAYVADGTSGLQIFNITNVRNPSLLSTYDTPGEARGVFIEGDIAFVADDSAGRLQLIDITDPQNPSFLGISNGDFQAIDVVVAGDHAFVACYYSDLQIIDISVPRSPIVVGTVDLPYSSLDISVKGNYVYVAQHNVGMCVIDISDPKNPLLSNTYISAGDGPSGDGQSYGVAVSGDFAYLVTGNYLKAIRISLHKTRIFESPIVAQSTTLTTVPSGMLISNASLAATTIIPVHAFVTYYLSADDGLHWEEVTPYVEHWFTYPGRQLKWKAVLRNNPSYPNVTVEISQISFEFDYLLTSPVVTTTSHSSSNSTPTFSWEDVLGAISYRFELDSIPHFNSSNFLAIEQVSTSYIPLSALDDGTWYWRVAAIDSVAHVGIFSEVQAVIIDTAAPNIDSPSDLTYEEGTTGNTIVWTPSDDNPFWYSISRDNEALISNNWYGDSITVNVDGLSGGTYSYVCTVTDVNNISTTDTVIVTVTTPVIPTTSTTPVIPTTSTTQETTAASTSAFTLVTALMGILIILGRTTMRKQK